MMIVPKNGIMRLMMMMIKNQIVKYATGLGKMLIQTTIMTGLDIIITKNGKTPILYLNHL